MNRLNTARPIQGRALLLLLGLILTALILLAGAPRTVRAEGNWWDVAWHFRVPLTVDANGYERTDKVVEADVNFAALFSSLGYNGTLDADSIRVLEVNGANEVIDAAVPFQFDEGANNNSGTLTFLLDGNTAAGASRTFHVYFDATGGSFNAPNFAKQVTLTDGVTDEGFASYRLVGSNSTLYYHKTGGGFSGLEDANGNDWISWSSLWGHGGDYRGIPNLVHPNDGGYFHPGRNTATSAVTAEGPLKVTIVSTSKDGKWQTEWDVFPDYASMVVTKKPDSTRYWFQYEGVPGGTLNSADRVVRSNGNENGALSGTWTQDLANEEWAYTYDPSVGANGRSLYMIHHQQDTLVDTYWPYVSMAILGFGRNDANGRFFSQTGQHFTFGLVDGTTVGAVEPVIDNAYRPLLITLGAAEQEGDPPPPPSIGTLYVSAQAAGKVELGAVDLPYGDEDILKYDSDTDTWTIAFDGSSLSLPTAADIDGLALDGSDFLISFDVPLAVPGISGTTDDSDIVRYTPGVGFSLEYDMSSAMYGLTTTDEDVDAIAFDQNGDLLVSTFGSFSVPSAGAGRDEDLLRWNGTTWELAFDGSHNAGLSAEDVMGAAVNPVSGDIYLTILGAFNVAGVGPGNGADIIRCGTPSLGPLATSCTYTPYWDAAAFGFVQIDALDIVLP